MTIEQRYRRKQTKGFITISLIVMASGLVIFPIHSHNLPWNRMLHGLIMTALCGFSIPFCGLLILERIHHSPSFRKIHHLLLMLLEIGLLLLTTLFFTVLGHILATGGLEGIDRAVRISLPISAVMTALLSFFGILREFLGKGFFLGIASGLYVGVRDEERIVAFIDLSGSTGIAEHLSPPMFFDLLNDFFHIVTTYCGYYDGTIYKYLGDGVILTWPDTERNSEKVFRMLTELSADIDRRKSEYRSRYGAELSFTAGVHSGKVLVGRIGTEKKELGYWGDTLNTAARLQSSCKRFGVPLLFSEPFIRTVYRRAPQLLREIGLKRLVNVSLRGKQGRHTLYTPNTGHHPVTAPVPGKELPRERNGGRSRERIGDELR